MKDIGQTVEAGAHASDEAELGQLLAELGIDRLVLVEESAAGDCAEYERTCCGKS